MFSGCSHDILRVLWCVWRWFSLVWWVLWVYWFSGLQRDLKTEVCQWLLFMANVVKLDHPPIMQNRITYKKGGSLSKVNPHISVSVLFIQHLWGWCRGGQPQSWRYQENGSPWLQEGHLGPAYAVGTHPTKQYHAIVSGWEQSQSLERPPTKSLTSQTCRRTRLCKVM